MKLVAGKPVCFVLFQFLVLIAVAFQMAGCASISPGTSQKISITSVPPGATVYLKNIAIATTPAVVPIPKKYSSIVLKFEKDGYYPAEAVLNRVDGGWPVAANVFWVLPVGFIVDYTYGGAFKLTPTEIKAELKEIPK